MHSGTGSIFGAFLFEPIRKRRQGLGVGDQRFYFFFAAHAGEVIHDFLEFGR